MVGSRRSSLNHGLSLKAQYEAALHDLTNLVDTAQDKMAADQKMTVTSVKEVQMLLDKHKVRNTVASRHCFYQKLCFLNRFAAFFSLILSLGVFPGPRVPYDPHPDLLQ